MQKSWEALNSMTNNCSRDEKIFCGVCGRRYRLPRILPCLHTFCSDCISNLQTYPTNDEENSSCDTDNAAEWMILTGNGCSTDNLVNGSDIIKPPVSFDSGDHFQKTLPRSRSRHAKLIERRMQRSKSCTDGSFEFKPFSHEDVHTIEKYPNKGCLKRSSSSKDNEENFGSPTMGRSIAKSTNFLDEGVMSSTTLISSTDRRRIILCPKCLKEAKVSETLEELPRNFMIERFVAHDALSSSGVPLTCDSCFEHDKFDDSDEDRNGDESTSKHVTARCVECQENLCSLCEFSHRRQKKTKRHQLILIEDTLNSTSSSNSSSMSTIPESVDEDTLRKNPSSDRPKLLNNVKRLKLPNLQHFGNLLWKTSDTESAKNGSEVASHLHQDRNNSVAENGGSSVEGAADKEGSEKGSPDFFLHKRGVQWQLSGKRGHSSTTKVDRTRPMSCLKHPDEELKLFCITCEESVCRDCVVLLHREHICELVNKELFQNQMDDVDKLIKAVIPKVEDVDDHLETLADLKVKVNERSEKVKKEINVFMDTFVEAIEKHRTHLLSQVTSLAETKERTLTVSQLHLQHMRSDVEQTCRFVADLVMGASDMEILSMKRLVTQRLRALQDVSKEPHMKLNGFLRFCPTERGEIINNFQMFGRVVARKPCAAKSFLEGDGLSTARISHKCVMMLTVCDTDGLPYSGSDVTIKAWIIFQEQSLKNIPVTLVHLRDGAHQLEFTPVYRGTHFLHVALNGQSVKDSPFKFSVKTRWRRHKGVWHCCTFCSTGGRKDVACGCGGTMSGGYQGCGHAHPGHPGGHHWSCCGKMTQNSECSLGNTRSSPLRQVTL